MLLVDKVNTFYDEAHVLFDVSLEINRGEVVSLLGRNGAGKTTTVKSIMGMVRPRTGSIQFKGKNILGWQPYLVSREGIGLVPDERRIFGNLTVEKNLDVGRRPERKGEWTLEKVYEHFPQLKGLRGRKGENLSGGEQQMLAIARTLMGNPELILMDEPTEGLAPIIVEEVMKIIRELKKSGITILIIEESSTLALSISERCYMMDTGKVVYHGKASELIENPALRLELLGI
jgi:branched-chain amino acid transport system ATP-binding protein